MALAVYSDLKSAIANYLQRTDLTTLIPDFITLTEKKIGRALRTLEIQATHSGTLAETNTLPTDFLELANIAVSYGTTSFTPDFVTPERMDSMKSTTPTVTGVPRFFTIRLGKTEYYPAPQAGTTFTELLTYYQRITALASAGDTNWLLTNHPDVYLYGSLLEAEAFIQNDPRLPLWKGAYEEALNGVKQTDDRKRFFKPLSVSLGLPGTTGFRPSIESGFY